MPAHTYVIRLAKQNYYQTLSIFGNIKSSCMLMFVNNFDITFLLTKEYELHYVLNLKSCFGKIIHLERDICKENSHLGIFL